MKTTYNNFHKILLDWPNMFKELKLILWSLLKEKHSNCQEKRKETRSKLVLTLKNTN
jgi:hypothetical protein